MRSAPAIGFEYRPSRALGVGIVLLTALAVFAIILSRVAIPLAVLLVVLALACGSCALWRHLDPRLRSATWRSDGSISITLVDRAGNAREVLGEMRDARVLGSLLVLHLRWPRRGRTSLWLLPDNLAADTRRRLRVRLNTDGVQPASVNADSL